jgi:hypothetical protein
VAAIDDLQAFEQDGVGIRRRRSLLLDDAPAGGHARPTTVDGIGTFVCFRGGRECGDCRRYDPVVGVEEEQPFEPGAPETGVPGCGYAGPASLISLVLGGPQVAAHSRGMNQRLGLIFEEKPISFSGGRDDGRPSPRSIRELSPRPAELRGPRSCNHNVFTDGCCSL